MHEPDAQRRLRRQATLGAEENVHTVAGRLAAGTHFGRQAEFGRALAAREFRIDGQSALVVVGGHHAVVAADCQHDGDGAADHRGQRRHHQQPGPALSVPGWGSGVHSFS
jgi:hypothetical protein